MSYTVTTKTIKGVNIINVICRMPSNPLKYRHTLSDWEILFKLGDTNEFYASAGGHLWHEYHHLTGASKIDKRFEEPMAQFSQSSILRSNMFLSTCCRHAYLTYHKKQKLGYLPPPEFLIQYLKIYDRMEIAAAVTNDKGEYREVSKKAIYNTPRPLYTLKDRHPYWRSKFPNQETVLWNKTTVYPHSILLTDSADQFFSSKQILANGRLEKLIQLYPGLRNIIKVTGDIRPFVNKSSYSPYVAKGGEGTFSFIAMEMAKILLQLQDESIL